MNTRRTETDEILNELTSIEIDDDDALTLLDDEEMAPISKGVIEDEDLVSFYSDSIEDLKPKEKKAEVYTEKVTPKTVVKKEEPSKEDIKELTPELPKVSGKAERYQKTEEKRASLDAYLNGSLDSKKDEVKVEKVTIPTPKIVEIPKEDSAVEPAEPPKLVPSMVAPKEEQVDIDSLNQLFAKVSSNVKGASDMVNKNAEIKKRIDEKFLELKKLQEEHEQNKQSDYAEINAYKEDVYAKLKEKKTEVEEQMTLLSRAKEAFEIEKKAFEKEKAETLATLAKRDQELDKSYQERVQGITQIEEGLVKRKEQLDIERNAIQQERIQCDKEKKELADNLLKFNQLVDDFTRGVDRFNETN